jgi:hypothetical protein
MKVNNHLSSQITEGLTDQQNNQTSNLQRGAELEKSAVPQLVKELMHFVEPEDSLQCFTRSCYLSLS